MTEKNDSEQREWIEYRPGPKSRKPCVKIKRLRRLCKSSLPLKKFARQLAAEDNQEARAIALVWMKNKEMKA